MPNNTDHYGRGSDSGKQERPIRVGVPGPDPSNFLILAGAYNATYVKSGYFGFYEVSPANNTPQLFVHPGNVVSVAYLDGHCASVNPADLYFNAPSHIWMSEANDGGAPWYMLTYVHR